MIRSIASVILTLVVVSTTTAQTAAELTAARQTARAAAAAYRTRDWQTYDEKLGEALRVQPNHPIWLYNRSNAAALRGDHTRALALLDTLAAFGYSFDIAADDDFGTLRSDPGFLARAQRITANGARIGASEPQVELSGPSFLPEGVAFDPTSGALFLSSVHERRIVRVDNGKTTTLADSTNGLFAVLGIAWSPRTRSLWAVTTAMAEMQGGGADRKGTALVEVDAVGGGVKRRITPPGDGHGFNDLTVADDGTVYISDPGAGGILEWTEARGLRELVPPGVIYNPSGLAIIGNWLYAADYSVGLVRIDRESGALTRLSEAAGVSTYGTDGLIAYNGDLLLIQNALRPHRVARVQLSADGLRAEKLRVLEQASPHFDEPTLGVVAGDALLYVANSRWGKFKDGKYVGDATLSGPVVLKLPLR